MTKQLAELINQGKRLHQDDSSSSQHFPSQLHSMLSCAEADGYSDVCSWMSHGRAFKVHDREAFTSKIMSRFFKGTRYSSFQRQLNLYGFIRMTRKGRDYGCYYHSSFLRGQPQLCQEMVRVKSRDPLDRLMQSDPDFYAMEPSVVNSITTDRTTDTAVIGRVSRKSCNKPVEDAALESFVSVVEDYQPTTTEFTSAATNGPHDLSSLLWEPLLTEEDSDDDFSILDMSLPATTFIPSMDTANSRKRRVSYTDAENNARSNKRLAAVDGGDYEELWNPYPNLYDAATVVASNDHWSMDAASMEADEVVCFARFLEDVDLEFSDDDDNDDEDNDNL